MNRSMLVFTAGLLMASLAIGQTVQTIKPRQGVMAPQAAQLDQDALARRQLEIDNKKLREENERLRQENAALNSRINEFTRLGGSEVRAYCSNETTSRNTAGATANCGIYTCDVVNGLCKDRCVTSSDCTGDTRCNVVSHSCEMPPRE